MWYVLLSVISIVAFAASLMARNKIDNIVPVHTITVPLEKIKAFGLYQGLALRLRRAEHTGMVQVCVADAAGQDVVLGEYGSPLQYNILEKKTIGAFVYSVYGDVVSIEVKIKEAL